MTFDMTRLADETRNVRKETNSGKTVELNKVKNKTVFILKIKTYNSGQTTKKSSLHFPQNKKYCRWL